LLGAVPRPFPNRDFVQHKPNARAGTGSPVDGTPFDIDRPGRGDSGRLFRAGSGRVRPADVALERLDGVLLAADYPLDEVAD